MKQEEFVTVVAQHICPILAGATVTRVIEDSPAHGQTAVQGNGQTMFVSPTAEAAYKVEIRRNQVFSADDARLVAAVVTEIVVNFNKTTPPYRDRVLQYAIEVGICKFLATASAPMLVNVLTGFTGWAQRTYEGRRITFSIVIDFGNKQAVDEEHPGIGEVLAQDFSALLSNSVESALLLSAAGAVVDYVNFVHDAVEDNTFAPWRFLAFANYATDNRVCFTLTDNGEILVFKRQKLLFSKRNDSWNYYNHGSSITTLAGGTREVRNAVYETMLDVSFARTGGCLAVVRLGDVAELVVNNGEGERSVIKRDDLLTAPTSLKSKTLNCLVQGRKLQELDRLIRKEMVGIDGATVLTYQGDVLAVGAIIKIGGGSTGGGRLAATKTLARYGTAIKISADGFIEAFVQGDGEQPVSVLKI